MDFLFDEPVATYVSLVVATGLLLIEVALPTFGVAGTLALVLAGVGIVGVADNDLTWWPLVVAAAGVVIWVALIAAHRPSVPGQVAAAAAFAAGSILFCAWTRDLPAVIAGVAGSLTLPAIFPRLERSARTLMALPPAVGMETLVGKAATVARWEGGGRGTVSVDGSLWDATSGAELVPGQVVEVEKFAGMRLVVKPVRPESSKQGGL